MQSAPATTSLIFRNDTILGVCEALGQDFGFNPNWLRIAFCAPIYWNPGLVIGTYLGLGLLVAVTRYAFPDKHAEVGKAAPAPAQVSQPREERELIAA